MIIVSKKLLLMPTNAATKLEGNNWQRNEGIHQIVLHSYLQDLHFRASPFSFSIMFYAAKMPAFFFFFLQWLWQREMERMTQKTFPNSDFSDS